MILRLPGMTDAEYIAAVDAAAPPLSEAQRMRLSALLGRERIAAKPSRPRASTTAQIDLMEVSA